jgi:phage repressor protein C with HTH and peptisase S24 domain
METVDSDWLKRRLSGQRGLQTKLANYLGLDAQKMSKTVSGVRRPQADEVLRILAFFEDVEVKREVIAVAGRVGAGGDVGLVDGFARGDGLYHVTRPPELAGRSVVAVEIAGDSMAPTYRHGDVIFYAREAYGVPSEALGANCVTEDEDGTARLKTVYPGSAPDLFNLRSINEAVPTLPDVRLRWAAKVLTHRDASVSGRVG